MKLLPFYLEDDGVKFSGSISLAQNIEVLSVNESIAIANYMNSCVVISEWLSNIRDALTNKLEVPSKTWSDGTYVWESSHIHYVTKYRVRLPKEFIAHVKKQIEIKFDPACLNETYLLDCYEMTVKKILKGDESFFDGSYWG